MGEISTISRGMGAAGGTGPGPGGGGQGGGPHRAGRMSRWRRRHHRKGWLYVAPAVALFALMIVYPIVRSFYLSFFDYSILEPDSARFVGMANYGKLLTQPTNLRPFGNTLYFTAIFVPPYVIGALLLALALNAIRRGAVFLRTLLFTPVVVSLAVSAVMWTLFYNPEFGFFQEILRAGAGAINATAGAIQSATGWLGPGPYVSAPTKGVLGSVDWAMIGIAIMCVWNGMGINVILFLVGLQRIPEDLYEAGMVDGAGAWQRFRHITLPQLRPTIYLVLLLSLIGAFKVFGQPYIMTSGGPANATLTYVMRLYNLAFVYGRFQLGYASALAYALAVFIFLFSLLMRRLNRPVD